METVYAYIDQGAMMGGTRWKQRRIDCTRTPDHADMPGSEHVVKLGTGPNGAAAMVSEVVCAGLLAGGGLRTLECRLVHVGIGFAAAYSDTPDAPAGVV